MKAVFTSAAAAIRGAGPRLAGVLAIGAALAASRDARADADLGVAPRATQKPDLTFRAYGELHAGFYAYGLDQNRAGGSRRDRRVELDTTRLALEVEARFADDLEVEFEIEFEHGGTGAAYELEYEEFGEFEQEVERGGEAIVEELYLRKVLGGRFAVSVGRFYVAVGQLSRYYRPTAYLAATRAEAETTVIPQVWDELGAQLEAFLGRVKVTAQVVNGLDSTGFSSQFWVSRGHQGRFESIRASDPAGVLRVDVQPRAGVEVGAAGYVGGTSRNRPKADLVPTCADGDDDVVAPCGYVAAPVVIADVHAALQLGPVRAQGTALYGWLGNANAVSARNDRLSNDLQVLRSPVSDQALAIWGEAGWDVAPALGLAAAHRLEPFVRLEHYDTMFRPRAELFDNPRFARTVATAGLSYQAHGGVFAKVDASHRRFGSSELRPENALHVATGFVF